MHGISARTGAPPARATRASEGHARVLLPCAFLLALVALLIAPVPAYADANYRTVLWSGDYASGKQYIVGADNKYDAAAYICGQTSAQVAAYDITVRYKLSSTDNDFSALADSLEKDWPGFNEDTLAQSLAETFTRNVDGLSLWDVMTQTASVGAGGGIILNQGALKLFQVNYWQDNVDCDIYAVDTTSDAVSRARDDLQEILNGGGGGTGGVIEGDYTVYNLTKARLEGNGSQNFSNYWSLYSNSSNVYYWDDTNNLTPKLPSTLRLKISTSQITKYQTFFDSDDLVAYVNTNIGSGNTLQIYHSSAVEMRSGGYQNSVYERLYRSNAGGTSEYAIAATTLYLGQDTEGLYCYANSLSKTNVTLNGSEAMTYVGYYGSLSAQEPTGPGNWPDPPENPTPPEPPTVPDPPENPEPDPPDPPIAPTPPPIEPPTNVIIPTGTTPADYTPWLRAILEQLQTLTSELANHCVHLQEEMQISVNELQDTLIRIDTSLENHIWDLFNGLEDYMHDLAVWLADQLDYNVNVDPYDDSSVLYWLRQIYSRLGNKPKPPTTIMDPDPTEPFDFWAWLLDLVNKIVGEIITDLVGDVAGLLDAFKSKFPFSIPWDIAALLALFDGVRATPQFTVRLPAVEGWYDEIVFNIDLTPYNSVAAVCRAAVNIWWVMCLVMRTDWMLGVMDRSSSFGERFVRKVYAMD